ncbi:LuxR C-terminal-related transcriptional regulator [Actinoplanes sp. GCM10030250]|uniref:helix-turn-helix transcriptional regulator n=1 Tax=Actinoplanes sp. GCM10030250 TaxID=3273376 RepID=UPI00360E37BC
MSPHVSGSAAEAFRLDEAVADVFGDLRMAPVLRRLLRHTGRLTGSVAGSVSLVDVSRGCYVKAAEFGVSCRLGSSFALDEGATGRAFGSRRPVLIPDYGQIRAGHLAAAHPARRGPAAAIPIWWRGDVIAVNVVFAPSASALSPRGVDRLEALSQAAAAAIVESGRRDPRGVPVRALLPGAPAVSVPAPFTPREAQVLGLLRQGLTYREMAGRLGLSTKTVDKHVAAIMRKTGTSNRTAAVVTAMDNGWVGNSPHTVGRARGS